MPYRTDLAVESASSTSNNLPEGITQKERVFGQLHINTVVIDSQQAGDKIGKPAGKYVTITLPAFASPMEISEDETEEIALEISALLPKEGLVLVVGLGNNDITPDAIGPRTARQVLATRHISADLAKESSLGDLRPTASLSPGVLGQTGIETSEIILSVVKDINPCAVIIIDALAARSAARLGNTIQISSAGISPGSGVMNTRKELSHASLGVPVVSIGIPTVVDATTLASDLLESDEQNMSLRRGLFEPEGQRMMITPRDIDTLIGRGCKILALAINKALQSQMTLEEISYLVG